jgi:hypothetical protein
MGAGLARLCPRGQTATSNSVGKGAGEAVEVARQSPRLCPPYTRAYLFSRLTVISGTSVPGVTIDTD